MSLTSVAGDSVRFSSVVAVYGPDFETADTLALPRTAVDLLVDEDKGEIWYGYAHDTTTFYDYGGCVEYDRRYIGFGGAVGFDFTARQSIGGGLAATAFSLGDVNSDDVNDLTALWTWAQRDWGEACGPRPSPSRASAGVWRRDGASFDTLRHTWAQASDGFNVTYIQVYPQLLLADLNLDGDAEVVLSWHHAFFGGYDSLHVEAFSLASGASLWRSVQPYAAFGIHDGIVPYTTILYDVDHAAPPEVLVLGRRPGSGGTIELFVLKADTGDTLFATDFRSVSNLNVTFQAAAHEPTHVIHATGSSLYRWRVDLGTGTGPAEVLPRMFDLKQPAPNPFNAGTRIAYSLMAPLDVSVSVFDVLGRHVITLAEGVHTAGDHEVVWEGYSKDGSRAASGVYFVRIQAESDYAVRRMCMIK